MLYPASSLQRLFCPAQPELACVSRLAFAKQRLATEGDWLLKIRCTLKNKGPLIAAKDNVEPTKASPRSGPCVPGRFSGHCVLAWSSPALRPGTVFAGIASTDVPQCNASDLRAVFHPREAGIATWRGLGQPCVPACSSPALRPPMLFGALRQSISITSRRSRSCIPRRFLGIGSSTRLSRLSGV